MQELARPYPKQAGTLNLPGVAVYVPNAELSPVAEGALCETCLGLSGEPLAHAVTDSLGSFTLDNLPAGDEIPLVFSIGRWRREQTITLEPCDENSLSDEQSRLPRNSDEGHIPKFAVITSQWDSLECMLRSLGVDDSEFGSGESSARVHLYGGRGGAQAFTNSHGGGEIGSAIGWWDDVANLAPYDAVLYSCEGQQALGEKPVEAREAFIEYVESGGRALLTHWHNVWIEHSPLSNQIGAQWGSSPTPNPGTGVLQTDFPAGQRFSAWLDAEGALEDGGQFPILDSRSTLDSVDEDLSRTWAHLLIPGSGDRIASIDFSTPVDADNQCGRVVFGDLHASPANQASSNSPFPDRCQSSELLPQEMVLLFQLFELTRCEVP